MKRFLIFYSTEFYPSMGMNDLQGDHDTIEECHKQYKSHNWNSFVEYHVFDVETRKIVFTNNPDHSNTN